LTPTLEQRTQAELEWRAPLQKLRATLPCAFLAGEPAITVGRRWLVVEAETDNQKGSFSQPARLSEQPSQRTR